MKGLLPLDEPDEKPSQTHVNIKAEQGFADNLRILIEDAYNHLFSIDDDLGVIGCELPLNDLLLELLLKFLYDSQ